MIATECTDCSPGQGADIGGPPLSVLQVLQSWPSYPETFSNAADKSCSFLTPTINKTKQTPTSARYLGHETHVEHAQPSVWRAEEVPLY